MKKILTVIGLVLFFLSAQMTFGDPLPEDTVEISQNPVIPSIKVRRNIPTQTEIAEFSYGDLLPENGEITSASIEFQFGGGNIRKLSQLDLYLDDILVLDLGAYFRGLSRAEQRALRQTLRRGGMIDFSLLLTEADLAALEDGEASLILKGNPRSFRSLRMGEVTLSITDPRAPTGAEGPEFPTLPPDDSGLIGPGDPAPIVPSGAEGPQLPTLPPDDSGLIGLGDPAPTVPIGAEAPEPATMLLVGSGLIGLAAYGRKKFFKK